MKVRQYWSGRKQATATLEWSTEILQEGGHEILVDQIKFLYFARIQSKNMKMSSCALF